MATTPTAPPSDSSPPTSARRERFGLKARIKLRLALDIPRAARHSFLWDSIAGMCAGAYMGMTFPFFVRIARGELNAPEATIAVMTAAPFIGNLLSPLWARQMEGKSKLPFVLGSWIPARALLFLMPLATFPALFVALVSGLQFIGTISSPAYTTLMRDIYPDRARGRLLGYVRVGAQTFMFLATLTTGRLLDYQISYRYLFPVAGLLGLAAAFSFSRVRPLSAEAHVTESTRRLSAHEFMLDTLSILRENVGYRWFALSVFTYGFGKPGWFKNALSRIAAERQRLRSNRLETRRSRAIDSPSLLVQMFSILRNNIGYRWFASSVMVYGFANLAMVPLYQLFQVDVLKISNTQIANLANCTSLSAIAGSFFWGRYMDRHGSPKAVFLSISIVALIPFIYLSAKSVTWLLIAAALSGFGFAGIELSYMTSILYYSEPGREAQYQALHSLLVGIRGLIAPLLAIALLKQVGYGPMFLAGAIVMLFGAFLQLLAVRIAHRTQPS